MTEHDTGITDLDEPTNPHDDPDEVPAQDDLDLEASEADVAEQRTTVVEEEGGAWEPVPDGVDPADRADQRRVVTPDEEEYR